MGPRITSVLVALGRPHSVDSRSRVSALDLQSDILARCHVSRDRATLEGQRSRPTKTRQSDRLTHRPTLGRPLGESQCVAAAPLGNKKPSTKVLGRTRRRNSCAEMYVGEVVIDRRPADSCWRQHRTDVIAILRVVTCRFSALHAQRYPCAEIFMT